MHEKIAKIDHTSLGTEDHGIVTAMLSASYGHSGQGVGGYCLDEPIRDADGKFVYRQGTAFGMEWVMRCIAACGVSTWEEIKGRTILVYFETDSFSAPPVGIGPLPTEPGRPFMFAEVTEQFFPQQVAVGPNQES